MKEKIKRSRILGLVKLFAFISIIPIVIAWHFSRFQYASYMVKDVLSLAGILFFILWLSDDWAKHLFQNNRRNEK